MNAVYRALAPVSDSSGCPIADPVELSGIPGGIQLTPPAVLDCPTAEAFARFARDEMQSAAIAILGSSIRVIRQDSAYVCRNRNGGAKRSEHAFGRAIDIGAMVMADKAIIAVKVMPDRATAQAVFLDRVRKAACGPFATVLGPGSDPAHELHFHFDLQPRKGKPFCQ